MRSSTDAYGRVTVSFDDLSEALYSGVKAHAVMVDPSPGVDRFNALCKLFDRETDRLQTPEPLAHSPEEEHAARSATWMVPEGIQEVDVRAFLLTLCKTPEEKSRVNEEMDLFEKRGLLPLLRTMLYLVDHWQKHNVLWGVGRGSSVASFCLYLIGVHRINPLRFGLSIHEFLKPD